MRKNKTMVLFSENDRYNKTMVLFCKNEKNWNDDIIFHAFMG